MSWVEASIRWYVVILALTWAFAPAVSWLCTALSDRGVSIVRPLAVLAAVYPAWLLASVGVITFGTIPIALTVLLAGCVGCALAVRRNTISWDWLRCLLVTDAAGLAVFVAYLWLRGFTPEILGTEKPMDVAFLASSARTVTMPPPDPWFAGESINYYYLGYVLHGSLGRLAGVAPQFSFNLALATVFSMTAVAAFGAAWNVLRLLLSKRLAAAGGVIASFLLVVSGNLYAPLRLIEAPRETVDAAWSNSAVGIGWRSSRIVCDGPRTGNLCEPPAIETITEFPYFSFLLGDLHPHVMALPYTVAAVVLGWNLILAARSSRRYATMPWLLGVAVTGAILGALYPLNAWDFPTSLFVAAMAVWAATGESLRRAARPFLVLAAVSIVAWLPFWIRYDTPARETGVALIDRAPIASTVLSLLGVHVGERTSAGEFLTMFGVPYLFGLVFVAAGLKTWTPEPEQRRFLLISSAAMLVPAVLLNAPVLVLCGVPLTLSCLELNRSRVVSARTAALALFSLALVLAIVVELIYVRDAFGSRMNTLFKFYYQIWTLFAIATGVAIPLLWVETGRRSWQRLVLAGAATFALVTGLTYPMVSTWQWTSGFGNWRGLDGLAYGEDESPDEVAAIRWLQQAALPGDVVLEAAGCAYRPFGRLPFNRISAFTGVPSVIGWGDNHQQQWRAGQPDRIAEIRQRESDVAVMYGEPNSPLGDAYDVSWLVVGDYESGNWRDECATAGPYPGISAPGFPGTGWEEAFRSGDTRIYRRIAN